MKKFHHKKLPDYSTLLSGSIPPDDIGAQSDLLFIWYNNTEKSWVGNGEKPHMHTSSDECFIVLKGNLVVEVEGERHSIGPREFFRALTKMEQISDYKKDNELRGKFNNLAREVFGFDFEEWYQKGFWDDSYVCHSFFKDGQILSNVSTSTFELVINDRFFNAIQIGTVMIKKEFRGKGLAVELTKRMIDEYGSDFKIFYLFAHDKVWNYYKKQGFIPINEYISLYA